MGVVSVKLCKSRSRYDDVSSDEVSWLPPPVVQWFALVFREEIHAQIAMLPKPALVGLDSERPDALEAAVLVGGISSPLGSDV